MLKISILSCRGVEVSSGGDEADRTSQAELECEIEGSATIGRVSQKLTPLAATSTKHAVHGLRSGVEPAPFNHNFAVFFLLCFTFSAIGWIFYIIGNSIGIKKTAFYLGVIFTFLSLFTFGMAWSAKQYQETVKEAIVFSGSVSVKSSPAESGTSIFVVHAGTFVSITDQVGDWVKVKIPDGNEGWILMADLEVI
jgi:hypothetical protein